MIIEAKEKDRIAIVYGRFQPLTKAHYAMMKKLIDQYERVFIFPVQGESAYKLTAKTAKGKESERKRKFSKNPLPAGIRAELIQKAFPQLPDSQIMKLKSGSIVSAIEMIERMHPRVDTTKVDVWAGPDEYESYRKQLDYLKKPHTGYDIKVMKFDVGTREEVSGTKLRKSLMEPDEEKGFEEYKKLIAPPLADKSTYERLRSTMKQLDVPHLESKMRDFFGFIGESI